MRDNVEAESPEDYFRKSITVTCLYCTLNEMKTRFTDLHARTALGLQLVPSIIENIAPYLSPPVNGVSGSAPEFSLGKHHLIMYNVPDFDYPFGIFKQFLSHNYRRHVIHV